LLHLSSEPAPSGTEWALMDDARRIERTFRFRDFREAREGQ
jgi:pterin-4a-carbinolamine dehydratase